MSEHARLSPSSAHRWIPCPGSLALEESLAIKKSGDTDFSREGTAAHELAQWTLTDDVGRCANYVGKKTSNGWKVTEEMATDTQVYVDNIKHYAEANTLLVEQRLPIEYFTGEKNAAGTADALIITSDSEELQIHDLKFGRGVMVYAEHNEQLMLYALGAFHTYSLFGEFKRFRLVIHQPRLNHLSEWDCTRDELMAFACTVRNSAVEALTIARDDPKYLSEYLRPGEKQCQWCKAAGVCPALAKKVSETVGAEFQDLTLLDDATALIPKDSGQLAVKMSAIDLIETWCKAVRSETERVLLAGQEVPGYKIVRGKQGNRAWTDEVLVEDMMKNMRLKKDDMYNMKLISPTDAEKLLKTLPRKWKEFQEFISRSEGKLSVAPASDRRPAISVRPVADDFVNLDELELA